MGRRTEGKKEEKKKREAELKKEEGTELGTGSSRDGDERFLASICPYSLLRYIMVNLFLLSLIFSMN